MMTFRGFGIAAGTELRSPRENAEVAKERRVMMIASCTFDERIVNEREE